MTHLRFFGRGALLLLAGLTIAGCNGWSYSPPLRGNLYSERVTLPNVQAAANAPRPGITPFNQSLTRDYASLGGSLVSTEGDTADGDYFSRKGLAAARGQVVPPENAGNWAIVTNWGETGDNRRMLDEARARLVAVLDAGARERAPELAARTQVSYDCWVEHMEQSWWTAMNGPCRAAFLAGLAQLEGGKVAAAPGQFRVYFEFDKSLLTADAMQVLQQAAANAKTDPNLRIMLVGKADLAGTDAYNMGLSHRRGDAVRAELQKQGVANTRIDERWVGKREPPVPTPDGVREPRNRVVEITIK